MALGAGASLADKHYKINRFSGDISYPLYMTHYPFMWVFATYVVADEPTVSQLCWIIPVSIIALIGFAYVVSEYLDAPVRSYLKDALKTKIARRS